MPRAGLGQEQPHVSSFPVPGPPLATLLLCSPCLRPGSAGIAAHTHTHTHVCTCVHKTYTPPKILVSSIVFS